MSNLESGKVMIGTPSLESLNVGELRVSLIMATNKMYKAAGIPNEETTVPLHKLAEIVEELESIVKDYELEA